MKPVILLSHKFSDQHWGLGRAYVCESNYCRALIKAGATPLITAGGDAKEMAALADGVLFTGGCDIEPQRYCEANKCNIRSDAELDEMEIGLCRAFYEADKPIFGICRGIQTVNVALGGTLYQDIPSQVKAPLSAHRLVFETGDFHHMLKAAPGSVIEKLFGPEFYTNSYHHQAVKDPGKGLKAAAFSDEGLIEAIEHETRPILGVQWHPERMIGEENTDFTNMMPLFEYFVSLCGGGGSAAKPGCPGGQEQSR